MRYKGMIVDRAIDYKTGNPRITFEIFATPKALGELEDIADSTLSIDLCKYYPSRSLDANALAWVMIDKLAVKTGIPKAEIYRSCIQEIGGTSNIVCVPDEAVKTLIDGWRNNGLGWTAETFPSLNQGYTNVILYYGSSTFDTATMARFIDHIMQNCEAVGIDTTPLEEGEKKGTERRSK